MLNSSFQTGYNNDGSFHGKEILIMPGYVTHYIFGREVYHNLKNNSLKKNLYYNRAAYGLGLQGPDIFFIIFLPMC